MKRYIPLFDLALRNSHSMLCDFKLLALGLTASRVNRGVGFSGLDDYVGPVS
jgi:hypothetical protein